MSVSRRRRPRISYSILLLLSFSAAVAHADFIETFDNGDNDGNWHLTSNPDRLLKIESNGGNPGAFLHGEVFAPVPTWYVPLGTHPTHFLGDYQAQNVKGISFSLDIFTGTQAPNRAVTLDLATTLGTGDFGQGLEAYKIGTDISTLPSGWKMYSFSLAANSMSIPPGWVLLHGDGTPGTSADWQLLMQDVETIGLELGKPGFAYPALNGWDLGLDNVRIAQNVAESDPGIVFPLCLVLLVVWSRMKIRTPSTKTCRRLPACSTSGSRHDHLITQVAFSRRIVGGDGDIISIGFCQDQRRGQDFFHVSDALIVPAAAAPINLVSEYGRVDRGVPTESYGSLCI